METKTLNSQDEFFYNPGLLCSNHYDFISPTEIHKRGIRPEKGTLHSWRPSARNGREIVYEKGNYEKIDIYIIDYSCKDFCPIISYERKNREKPHPFGRVVIAARQRKGWTRYKLIAASGHSSAQLYALEKGLTGPSCGWPKLWKWTPATSSTLCTWRCGRKRTATAPVKPITPAESLPGPFPAESDHAARAWTTGCFLTRPAGRSPTCRVFRALTPFATARRAFDRRAVLFNFISCRIPCVDVDDGLCLGLDNTLFFSFRIAARRDRNEQTACCASG